MVTSPTVDVYPPGALVVTNGNDDSGGTTLTGTQRVVIGTRIQLHVRAPAGRALTNVQWTLPSGAWINEQRETAESGLSRALPISGTTATFFWVKGGDQTVSVSATATSTRLSASIQFRVVAPTVESFHLATSSVTLNNTRLLVQPATGGNPAVYRDLLQMIAFDAQRQQQGCVCTATVVAPAGGAGHIGVTQLIRISRSRRSASGPQSFQTQDYVLDDLQGVIYDCARVGQNTGTPIVAGGRASIGEQNHHDSPDIELPDEIVEAQSDEHFKVYLRYRPTGGVWVTLKKATWSWRGHAQNDPEVYPPWQLSGQQMSASTDGESSSELPSWTSKGTDHGLSRN